MRMHAGEAEIDAGLVRRLLAGQFPEWAWLPVEEIPSSGTVNAMYRVGESLTVRLPRIVGGVEDIEKEYEWLQRLGPLFPVEVPSPLALGKPAEGYPWPWSIYRWIDGVVPDSGSSELAGDLAAVVRAMRKIELPDGPAAYRGGPLETQDAATRAALVELEGLIDCELALTVWEDALAAEPAPPTARPSMSTTPPGPAAADEPCRCR